MDGGVLLNILIFGMIAVFVGLRLYSVLGTRTGREPKPGADPFVNGSARDDGFNRRDNVTPFPARPGPPDALAPPAKDLAQSPSPALAPALRDIRKLDPRFDPDGFLAGAGRAYEAIVGAFAIGDKATLKSLLDASVFDGFVQAIDARIAQGHTQETQITTIKGAEIKDMVLRGSVAEITVRFACEMTIVTRDGKGAIIAGSPASPREVIDLWTFARDLRSSDPNWLLVATGTAT